MANRKQPSRSYQATFDDVNRKFVDLCSRQMCDGNLEALVRALQDDDEVAENIYIIRNRLTLADGRFAKALVRNKTVVELELSSNLIGAEGIKHLAAAIKVNCTLRIIYLGGNYQIGDDDALLFLADALVSNKSLKKLKLNSCNIRDVDAQSLATALLLNKNLRELWLQSNRITNVSTERIINALDYNHGICLVDFWWNDISQAQKKKLGGFLSPKRNQKLLEPKHITEIIALRDDVKNELLVNETARLQR